MKSNMRMLAWLSLVAVLCCASLAQEQSSVPASAPTPVFREPFTLKLRIDKQHSYEEHFDKIPYVAENDVYLFAGDNFGVNLTATKEGILNVTYQPNTKNADFEFKFTQEKAKGGRIMMLLVIQNRLNRMLLLDALITIPEKKEVHNTSILPVEARHRSFESWPNPIVQLVLRNFRYSANAPNQGSSGPPDPRQSGNSTSHCSWPHALVDENNFAH
jgi:hypothetical protein